MPARTQTARRLPAWTWGLPLAGLALMIPFAAFAHEGANPHPHGIANVWVGVAAVLGAGAGWGYAVWRQRR